MEKRFIADMMLGRLARWLKALGYDVIYTGRRMDSKLMLFGFKAHYMILTRNRKLYKKIGHERALFISSDDFREQLREVITALGLKYHEDTLFTRCLSCNHPLAPVSKEQVQLKAPPYIYHTIDTFRMCPGCKRIFWSGTHIDEMKKFIETLWGKKGDQE